MKTNLTQDHWEIYNKNSYFASFYGRLIVLGLVLLSLYWEVNISFLLGYLLLDSLQYTTAAIMYNILARSQELDILDSQVSPSWVNYPAKSFWLGKLGLLIYFLGSLII